MAGETIKLDFDVLGGHEDEIREIADKVQQALDATGTAQALDFDAFGLVGQVFAIPIQMWLTTADGFLAAAVEAGHEVADRVKTAHSTFLDHEDHTKGLIDGIGKELPGMTETQENPLVATSESGGGFTTGMGDSSKGELDNLNAQTSGSGIFNDAAATLTDFRNGDWGNAALDIGTDALDLLGAAMDPLGTLASAGVGWLIEHISFLKDGLDKLAGKPEAITAKAVTWTNISKQLTETADHYEQSAKKVGQSFSDCLSANAYQKTAESYVNVLRGAAGHAQGASTAMNIGAALVGTERGLIRDMISSFIGELIIKALAALAASWCTFGGTIAAFIADSVVEGGILAEKISTRITKIVEKLESLAKGAGKSKAALEGAANALKKVGKGVDKIVDKSVEVGAKLEKQSGELKDAARAHGMSHVDESVAAKADRWSDSAKERVPGRDTLAGPADKVSEHGRSFTSQEKWREGEGVPKWNTADTVGVGTEGRRQENEQIDRYHEASEAYEKEHPEEEPAGAPTEGGGE